MHKVKFAAGTGTVVLGKTGPIVGTRVKHGSANTITFDLTHVSNATAGTPFVLSANKNLSNPFPGTVVIGIATFTLWTTQNSSVSVNTDVMLAVATQPLFYFGYAGFTSVGRVNMLGEVIGACDNLGIASTSRMLVGEAIVGCPRVNADGESILQVVNASLGGMAGVVQVGAVGGTVRISGAKCSDRTGTDRLVITDTGVVCTGAVSLANGVTLSSDVIRGHSGTVSFGTDTITTTGTIQGGTFAALSDARLKRNIRHMPPWMCMLAIMQLRPVSYTFRDDTTRSMRSGFVAQEVKRALPHVVRQEAGTGGGRDENAVMMMLYQDLFSYTVGAVQLLAICQLVVAVCGVVFLSYFFACSHI